MLVIVTLGQGEFFEKTTASEDARLGWCPLRRVQGQRAIVHAYAIRKTKVVLESWEDEDGDDSVFFRASNETNDEIMDSLALLF